MFSKLLLSTNCSHKEKGCRLFRRTCYQHMKRSRLAFLLCFPTFLLSLHTFLLLTYNGFYIFYMRVPFTATYPESAKFSSEIDPVPKLSSSVMYSLQEENLSSVSTTHSPLPHQRQMPLIPINGSPVYRPKQSRNQKIVSRYLRAGKPSWQFSARVKQFFSDPSCKLRFFMTWISSLDSFGEREHLAMESLFKSQPNACLVVVSSTMDSSKGNHILNPFLFKGFRVIAVSPDFDYLLKNTHAESWFDQLKKGNIDPGEVSLGQNLSNLIRLALLYKFGGIYIDTDVIVRKSFSELRNTIGAQTRDPETGNWSRLNNAVLIFDKKHPLLFNFIQEFALTFDGNKWGHNGPYLVSRVVSRLSGRTDFNVTVFPPTAFYPVDYSRILSLFEGPKDSVHSKWLHNKLRQIQSESYAVHLWNRQSRKLKVEEGSIINHIMSASCLFCNSSSS